MIAPGQVEQNLKPSVVSQCVLHMQQENCYPKQRCQRFTWIQLLETVVALSILLNDETLVVNITTSKLHFRFPLQTELASRAGV